MIRRFEDWGIDHLNFLVAFALTLSIIALVLSIVVVAS